MCMEKFPNTKFLNSPFLLFFILSTSFAHPLQTSNCFITFFISDMLQNTSPSSLPVFHNIGQLPFSEPNGDAHGWFPFLTSVQALKLGSLKVIEEEMMGTLKGKVQGIYVTSSEDDSNGMVAMRVILGGGKSADTLRFFGELRPGLSESHIPVVGGTGKYHGANGFAVVKEAMQGVGFGGRKKKKLAFTVYIK